MAQGYSRASRKPGVVLTTSGPGATNLITPLQDALKDGTPLVVLTGEVATNAMDTDAFQEADAIGITGPCAKWNPVVRDIRDLPARPNNAFRIAQSGRKSPVLVALPKDVTSAVLEAPAEFSSFHWGFPKLDNPIFDLMPSQPTDQRALNDARTLLTKLRNSLYTQVTECFRVLRAWKYWHNWPKLPAFRCHWRWVTSDVGSPVLPIDRESLVDHFRGSRDHGFRASCSHWRPSGTT